MPSPAELHCKWNGHDWHEVTERASTGAPERVRAGEFYLDTPITVVRCKHCRLLRYAY